MKYGLEEFMGRSFRAKKGGIRSIIDFTAVDVCVKHCYQKYVSMKMYVLKDAQSIYGLRF